MYFNNVLFEIYEIISCTYSFTQSSHKDIHGLPKKYESC